MLRHILFSFNYISTCDNIIGKFEKVAPELASKFGPVPVVGVGHSCGSLLQLLITTLFPDTPRAANALLSYNNKEVKDVIPLFDDIFAPFLVNLANRNNTNLMGAMGDSNSWESIYSDDGVDYYPRSAVDLLNVGLRLGRSAVEGSS